MSYLCQDACSGFRVRVVRLFMICERTVSFTVPYILMFIEKWHASNQDLNSYWMDFDDFQCGLRSTQILL